MLEKMTIEQGKKQFDAALDINEVKSDKEDSDKQ